LRSNPRAPTIWTVLALILASSPLRSETPSGHTAKACLTFVQEFYNWYAPVAGRSNKIVAYLIAVRSRPSAFGPELARFLRQDAAAQAQAHEIVGLDFDPILASQDPDLHYVVANPILKGEQCTVRVYRVVDGKQGKEQEVSPELKFQDGRWFFVNFYYDNLASPNGRPNLLGILRKLRADRARGRR
jgi:hypothetical protein